MNDSLLLVGHVPLCQLDLGKTVKGNLFKHGLDSNLTERENCFEFLVHAGKQRRKSFSSDATAEKMHC